GMANIEMELQNGEKLYFRGKATADGKDFLQTEGGVFTVEPKMTDIKFEDTGESNIDDRVVGWEAKLKLTVSQETLELIQLA
ncbi:hypothetical protein LAM21_24325, partial [Mycobacterium tuberculosis]|nr:hypothetical protein [Mycobacterium tuberculosis]